MSPLARRISSPALVAMALCWLPSGALACSVCYNPKEESRMAYLLTTGLLTLMPLIFMGAVLLWIRARVIAREAEDAAAVASLDIHRTL